MEKKKKVDKTFSTPKDPETKRLITPETAEEKLKNQRISTLLLDAELLTVDIREDVLRDSKVDYKLGELLKIIKKIQKIGGWEPLDI